MYHVYNTKAVIIKGFNRSEKDRFFRIFTKDLGLIDAVSISSREGKSKLRYSLQDLSLIDLSVVLGSGGFRIINCISDKNLFFKMAEDRVSLDFLKSFFAVFESLVVGQERDEEVFCLIEEMFREEKIDKFKYIFYLSKTLILLGYLSKEKTKKDLEENNYKDIEVDISNSLSVSDLAVFNGSAGEPLNVMTIF